MIGLSAVAAVADDVRIANLRSLRGPNLWSISPVVIAELRVGALASYAPRDVGEVADGAAMLIGDEREARRTGDDDDPLASWGTLLVAFARALQRRAGAADPAGRVVAADPDADRWTVVVGFDEEELAVGALYDAARIVRDLLRGDDPEIDALVAELTRTYHRARPDPVSLAVIDAARRRGIPVRRNVEDGSIQLGLGATLHRLPSATTHSTDVSTGAVLDTLYPPGAPTTIPVIAVTGTNGKTTTTRLIAHLFREHGRRVGYTTTDGVYYQERLLMEGDLTGPFAANMILSHPQVDVAVLETARGGILRAGLGYSECDVAVVLNVTADHLGMGGIDTVEQLADVKAVVPSVVRRNGYAVLNADDPLVAAMRERTPGRVAYFSMMPTGTNPLVELHLAAGDIIARVEGTDDAEELVIRQDSQWLPLGRVAEVPLTFGGHARFQIGNLLAAALVAFTQGVPLDTIRRGLMTFAPSASRTPGRLNMIETVRGRVLLDYAHNAAAIAGLLDFVRRMPAGRRMALLGVPGDRRDEDLRAVGRLCAGLDLAVFKEHADYRRGRAPGETARIMAEGALSAGMPLDRVWSFDDEAAAVAATLDVMRAGDVVALIADDAFAVGEQLRPFLVGSQSGDRRAGPVADPPAGG